MQNLYLLDVFVNIDTNEVAPHICNHDDGKQICHTFLDPDMRVFDVEATALQTFEHRLNSAIAVCTYQALPLHYNRKPGSETPSFLPCL